MGSIFESGVDARGLKPAHKVATHPFTQSIEEIVARGEMIRWHLISKHF